MKLTEISYFDSTTLANINFLRHSAGVLHPSTNIKWSAFVEKIYKKPISALVSTSISSTQSLYLGNKFKYSSYGKEVIICGAFLDYGPMITYDEKLINFQYKIANSNSDFHCVTKEITDELSVYKQTHAIVQVSNFNSSNLMNNITSRARNDLRRAEKFDLKIVERHANLETFFKMYVKKMKEFGTPHHGLKYFVELINTFQSDVIVGVARYMNIPVAASIDLKLDGSRFHLYAVSEQKYQFTNASDFLLWNSILSSTKNGDQNFWLGRSLKGSGVESFKKKWNPTLYGYFENKHSENPGHQEESSTYTDWKSDAFSKAWRASPDMITKSVGPQLRKLIP